MNREGVNQAVMYVMKMFLVSTQCSLIPGAGTNLDYGGEHGLEFRVRCMWIMERTRLVTCFHIKLSHHY